jgi:hypothetical protein
LNVGKLIGGGLLPQSVNKMEGNQSTYEQTEIHMNLHISEPAGNCLPSAMAEA